MNFWFWLLWDIMLLARVKVIEIMIHIISSPENDLYVTLFHTVGYVQY